jgi:hypothetical protein
MVMPKPLVAMKNPEFLAGTVAAMRLLSGERQPQTQMERDVLAQMQASNLSRDAAKRIVAAFSARPKAERELVLGRFADESAPLDSMAAPESHVVVRDHRGGASSGGTTGSGSTSRAGHTSGTTGPLSEVLTTGTPPGIRYTVRYKGLWCEEETDGPGSDEIYIITSGLAINNDVNSAVPALTHPLGTQQDYYADVDSLDKRIGPVAVVYTGSPDTLSLAVVVMEHDYGNPNYYRDDINTFVEAAIIAGSKLWPWVSILLLFKGSIVDAINAIFGTGDDVISSEVVTWERSELEALALQTPSEYQGWKLQTVVGPRVNVPTGLFVHFVTKHRGDGAEYEVGFDIERDPPRPDPVIL